MEQNALKTWIVWFKNRQNGQLWNASLEAATFYNATIECYRKAFESKEKVTLKSVYNAVKTVPRTLLHSQTAQAAHQDAAIAVQSFFKALKTFSKCNNGFSGKPRFPYRSKRIFTLTFKESAIRIKNGNILLSMAKGQPPIFVPWRAELPKPRMVKIRLDRGRWKACIVMDDKRETIKFNENKTVAVDLGVKRLATTFDGKESLIFSGKPILSLNRLSAKITGKKSAFLRKFKVGSRKHRKASRSFNKQLRKVDNSKRDFLHKSSRAFVNYCHQKGAGKIVFGDCADTHRSPNVGKVNNQKVSSGCEQKFRKYVEFKFSGVTDLVSE